MLEVTAADETGWEFETLKRVYANLGLDADGAITGVAWKIAKPSPQSTALKAEETRIEKLRFSIDPRDGKQFTITATVRYHYFPAPPGRSAESPGATMAQATVMVAGKRPS